MSLSNTLSQISNSKYRSKSKRDAYLEWLQANGASIMTSLQAEAKVNTFYVFPFESVQVNNHLKTFAHENGLRWEMVNSRRQVRFNW